MDNDFSNEKNIIDMCSEDPKEESFLPITSNTAIVPTIEPDKMDYYGKYIKKSRACIVCTRRDHMEINMMRAKKHLPLSDISYNVNISVDNLTTHFNNHYIISSSVQKIINIKEDTNQESRELVASILEGNIDLFAGAQGVLEAKGQRLHFIQNRIKELSDHQETRILEDIEIQEFFQMNKLAEEVENSILKTWQIIDKRLFPISRDDLSNAILSYKLGVLSKILDDIQIVFVDFEKNPAYANLIQNLRISLSEKFNFLEDSILKSGGVIQGTEKAKAKPTEPPTEPEED